MKVLLFVMAVLAAAAVAMLVPPTPLGAALFAGSVFAFLYPLMRWRRWWAIPIGMTVTGLLAIPNQWWTPWLAGAVLVSAATIWFWQRRHRARSG